MAVNFPSNPTNGDIHNEKGRRWIYDSTSGAWKSIVNSTTIDTDTLIEGTNLFYTDARVQTKLGSVSGDIIPDTTEAYDLGSASNKFRDLYLSGNSIELGNKTITEDNIPEVDLAIAPEVLEIQVSAPQAGQDTAWLWTWLTSSLPYARREITNSPEIQVPLYLQGTYTINNYAAYDLFDQMTQTHSLYLKWIDGAGTDNLIDWAVSTGPVSDSHPDINGGNATDVQRINISVPSTITLPTLTPPNVSYTVTNNGAGAYTFSGAAKGDNPNIGPFYRGGTYTFNVSATGHPFYLTTDNGTNFSAGTYFGEYTNGVTGSRSDSGTVTIVVPNDAPDTLYYQCGNHSAMRGAITIKDLAIETNNNGNYIVYFQHTQEGHKTPVELRPIPSLVNQMCLVYDAGSGKFVPQDLATYVENTPSFENKIREVAGTAELVVEDGSAVVAKVNVYQDSTYLPLVGNNAGDQAFATDINKLYIWDGSAWQQAGSANTDELGEGSSNLYYTDARVASYLSSNDFDTATNIIASITDSAPATLDTLNELAAALGDDPNFATTVSTNIGTKVSKSGDTMTGTLNIESGGQLRLKGTSYTHPADNVGVLNYDTVSGNFDIDARSNGGSTNIRFSTSNSGSASTKMFIGYDGNVGIGTTSPSKKFAVSSSGANGIEISPDDPTTSTNRILSYNRSTSSFTPLSIGADHIRFYIEDTERMRITSGGDVSIGSGHAGFSGWRVLNMRQLTTGALINFEDDDGTRAFTFASMGSGMRYQAHIAGGYHRWETNATANALYITDGGNIGIGTANPVDKLHIYGNEGNSTMGIVLQDDGWGAPNGQYKLTVRNSDGAFAIRKNTSTNFDFATSDDHLVLTSSGGKGKLGINRDTNLDSTVTIEQATDGIDGGIRIYGSDSNSIRGQMYYDGTQSFVIHGTSGPSGEYSTLRFATGTYNSPQIRMSINKDNGHVGIGTTTPDKALDVAVGNDNAIRIRNENGSNTNGLSLAVGSGSPWMDITEGKEFRIKHTPYANIGDWNNGSNARFVIDSNGNIGIGTTSPDRSLHVNGQVRVKSLLTDTIKQWAPTGNYTAGTSYVFSTRSEIASLGYGDGMYRFVIYTNSFNAGLSHYSTFVSYDPFYFTNTGSNAPTAFTFNWSGVAMGHAPNTGNRAADLVIRHKYGVDGTYPANQTFEFIPTVGLSNLNSGGGYEFYIRLYKIG